MANTTYTTRSGTQVPKVALWALAVTLTALLALSLFSGGAVAQQGNATDAFRISEDTTANELYVERFDPNTGNVTWSRLWRKNNSAIQTGIDVSPKYVAVSKSFQGPGAGPANTTVYEHDGDVAFTNSTRGADVVIDGDKLWIASRGGNQVLVYETGTWDLVTAIKREEQFGNRSAFGVTDAPGDTVAIYWRGDTGSATPDMVVRRNITDVLWTYNGLEDGAGSPEIANGSETVFAFNRDDGIIGIDMENGTGAMGTFLTSERPIVAGVRNGVEEFYENDTRRGPRNGSAMWSSSDGSLIGALYQQNNVIGYSNTDGNVTIINASDGQVRSEADVPRDTVEIGYSLTTVEVFAPPSEDLELNVRPFMHHGTVQSFEVVYNNSGNRMDVTGSATVTSGNTSAITVNSNSTITSTNDTSVNERVVLTAEYSGLSPTSNVTVANVNVGNLDILPLFWRINAVLTDWAILWIIAATIAGVIGKNMSSTFGGVAAFEMVVVMGWVIGEIPRGVAIVATFYALFVGLNVAANIDYSVRE